MPLPRFTVVPVADHQVSFQAEGAERFRWHHGPQYPRPFFYPLVGPASGLPLTRMGHPGAPDHDHHRSIWFAHNNATGIDFWADGKSKIVQRQWLAYEDGGDEAVMAVRLGWNDGHDPKDLLEQDVYAALRLGPGGTTLMEVQTTIKPIAERFEFGKTNFGFLAVRVAKAISATFGCGRLTNSEGLVGEKAIFGQRAKWMDYSGEQIAGKPEGITFFDHPANRGHPTHWHVRDDGWMGASACFAEPWMATKAAQVSLRYLIHAHPGLVDSQIANAVLEEFGKRPPFELVKAPGRSTAWGVRRRG